MKITSFLWSVLATVILTLLQASPVCVVASTFSDANWISMNPSIFSTDHSIDATAVDNSENLYIGGRFTVVGKAGANGFAFTGRVNGRKLAPGLYRLSAKATDAAGNTSKAAGANFRIVKR